MSQTTYISEMHVHVIEIKIFENVLKNDCSKTKFIGEFNTVSLLPYRNVYWVGELI